MSGFFFLLRTDGRAVEERLLHNIASSLEFRGLDATSVWAKGHFGGCFTWMRTGPAVQAKQQPVSLDDRLWLWGDVRLDARRELRQEIAETADGADEDTTSEELLLRAWEKWGVASLEKVIGDFSFALWDAREETLWCARDFVGPRPFYYAHVGKTFCCSNTLEVLRLAPEISGELDEKFLGDFFLEGWNVEPSRTVYRDIHRLPAGHLLKFVGGSAEVRRFRKLPIEEPIRLKRADDYVNAYLDVLGLAVKERLPEGAAALYLSGGLDSGSVCAVAGQLAGKNGRKRLRAFTFSWNPFFDDPEPAFAQLTAEHLGIAHEILGETKLVPFEGTGTEQATTPEPSDQMFFQRDQRQWKKIAAHANVVLSGDGGDDVLTGQGWPYLVELNKRGDWAEIVRAFGGYFWTRRRFPALRGGFRRKLQHLLGADDPFKGYPSWLDPEFEARANLRQRWLAQRNRRDSSEHPYHPEAYRALHSGYWASVLETEDAGWNRVRLETRAPLLDLRVLKFLLRLPPVPWCMDKELPRRAMRDLLPAKIVDRRKTPLRRDPVEVCHLDPGLILKLRRESPGELGRFVKWTDWCETFLRPKGSLKLMNLRPLSLLYWLKAVENRSGIQ